MMPECDPGEPALGRVAVKHPAAQPRTQPAHGLSFGKHALDDAVGVLLDGFERDAARREVSGQHVGGEPRLLLVEVDGDDLEVHGCIARQSHEHVHHRVRILAARHACHHPIAILDHPVVHDCLADQPAKTGFESFHVRRFAGLSAECSGVSGNLDRSGESSPCGRPRRSGRFRLRRRSGIPGNTVHPGCSDPFGYLLPGYPNRFEDADRPLRAVLPGRLRLPVLEGSGDCVHATRNSSRAALNAPACSMLQKCALSSSTTSVEPAMRS